MPAITGTIKDSGGNPLTGVLRINLDQVIVNESTSPNSLHLPVPRDYSITSGVVNIDVPESATDNTTYRIQFVQSNTVLSYFFADGSSYVGPKHFHSDTEWYTGAVHTVDSVLLFEQSETRETIYLDFRTIIPNVPAVAFSALLPTGITTDRLDTSLRRLAEILTQDVSFVNALRGGPRPKGVYASTTYYQLGDAVTYGGSWWYFISETPAINITPSLSTPTYWQQISTKGDAGGTGGTDTAYDATGWNGATFAPTANAIRDKIETLAPLASPAFTGHPTATTQLTTDDSTRLATTAYATAKLAAFLASPAFTGAPTAPTAAADVSTTQLATTAFVKSTDRYSKIIDTKSVTQSGGSSIAGTQTRTLNSIEINSGDVISLSSSIFTLRIGTYRFRVSAPAHQVGVHRAWLLNTTLSQRINGTSERAPASSNVQTRSEIVGMLTLTAASTLSIQHYTELAVGINGLGAPTSLSGVLEIYTVVEIWRVD
jgi:hypothetical protein